MLFSKKKKKAEEPKESKVKDKVAKGIAGFLLSVQNKFASFMSGRINNLSSRSKQFSLAIFCLMFGGCSIYAFLGAFRDSENSGKAIKPDQVVVPKYYDQSDSEFKEPQVSEKVIIRINRFKKYMDSLSRSAKGRPEYDSILKARPGLMDSIKVIEEIYYSQSK
jgi:hypothetical protein